MDIFLYSKNKSAGYNQTKFSAGKKTQHFTDEFLKKNNNN